MPSEHVQAVLSHKRAQFQASHVADGDPVVADGMMAALPSIAHFQVPGLGYLKTGIIDVQKNYICI